METLLRILACAALASALSQLPGTGGNAVLSSRSAVARHGGVAIESVNGTNIWDKCSEEQLSGSFKPHNVERCLQTNLVYVRVPKCSSTSFSSVLRRISARYGLNGVDAAKPYGVPEPRLSSFHKEWTNLRDIIHEHPAVKPKVMVTMIRDPIERMLSHYSYFASVHEDPPHVKALMDWLQKYGNTNYMYDFLKAKEGQSIDRVLSLYEIVGITERFDESVVLLMDTLGLESFCDVAYTDGKIAGKSQTLTGTTYIAHVPFSEQPKQVRDYMNSKVFRNQIQKDLWLYRRASKRLDTQIDLIGRAQFEEKVDRFRRWKEQALEACKMSPDPLGTNESAWRAENCYVGDFGCGYRCLDNFCSTHPDM